MAGEYDATNEQSDATLPANGEPPALPQAEKEIVGKWLKKIKAAEKHWAPVFKRMKQCQQIAAHGAPKEWLNDEMRYTAPIINRHINLAVAQLYAKNPQAVAEPREKLLNTVWDGTTEQVMFLGAQAQMGDPVSVELLLQIQQDIAQAQVAKQAAAKMAKTLTILHEYQIDEQPYDFKTQVKALVRRTKVNGVGYVKLTFVREMDMRPETAAMLEDSTAKLRAVERLMAEVAEPGEDADELARQKAQLETLVQDMTANPDRVVREQVVYDYPKSTEIVLDPKTRHLKSLLGCGWLAQYYDLTVEEIGDIYRVDIEQYMAPETRDAYRMLTPGDCEEKTYRVYEIQDKRLQQAFTVCEGYEGFLRPPAEPDVFLERFFSIYPLVFNEIEHDDEIYPPSDVWAARHTQFEYNRSREGLREHRVAARPYWLGRRGRLDEQDKARLQQHAAHEIIEVSPDGSDAPLSSVVESGPTASIDPNLYEVESTHQDMQRIVGTQEANLGGTSGATATETSVAENSRMATLADNVDDLDDMLTLLARDTGKVLLMNATKERVLEIVGPGAAWPDMAVSRREAAAELLLKVRAGSSGRPNQAQELANIERAWPALQMLPGINPEPLGRKYAALLDIDADELLKEGALSITAQNAMAKPAAAPPASGNPEDQGAAGGDNAERPPQEEPGAQPAYPGPGTGESPMVN